MAYEKTHPDAPWLTAHAIAFLEDWLRPEDTGAEWGSGRSTLWFAQRIARLLSIEHNREWYLRVRSRLDMSGIPNVDLHLCPVQASPDDGTPPPEYLLPVASLQNECLDFALVDGIFRDACVRAVMPKLKPGGLLVLDNANRYLPHASSAPGSVGERGAPLREPWGHIRQLLSPWRQVWTTNGVTDTAFFIKPPHGSE
jgi:hypothetical protein